MRDDSTLDRRRFVKKTTVAVIGATSLAGCGGGAPADDPDGGGDDGGGGGTPPTFDGWMDGVGNYEGVVDETSADEVTVRVGASGNGGNYAYDPPAVRVTAGTTVRWEWTGKGQQHNVVDEDDAFESELTEEGEFTFEHEFGETGTYTYLCVPHESLGMKGVVVVE